MDRCVAIQRRIMDAWQQTNSFNYVAQATDSVDGLSLHELRQRYFAIGPSAKDLTEVPFHDMLVVFSLIEQESRALQNRKRTPGETEFKITFQVSTDFPDEDVARLLSQFSIDTPFDRGKRLRVVASDRPEADDAGAEPG